MRYFEITCFWYNPNITDKEEYDRRKEELLRLTGILNEEYDIICRDHPIKVISEDFDPDVFLDTVRDKDLAGCPEGGDRCRMCFDMRLGRTFETALQNGFDYFTTTLTISPHKDARLINNIGNALATADVRWLPSDFKKRDGFRQSVELSRKYGLYRQNYCGCVYSVRSDT